MKDIPFFTTEYGVASLILREIPYRQEAYIKVQDAQSGQTEQLLQECMAFCRAAGAERIYCSTGASEAEPHTRVFEMRGTAQVNREQIENLFPVTEQTVGHWRQIHNQRMAQVDNAATLTAADEKRILESGGAYFVHRDGRLLGIGWLEGEKLLAVAAVEPGAGFRVLNTLLSIVEGASITLEVASTNEKAIHQYEKFGFIKTREICRWYQGRAYL